MLEDALNRLAAAIEAQTIVQTENQRLFAELLAAGRPVTPAAAVVIEAKPERKVRKAPEQEPEPTEIKHETDTRPVNRKDLMDLAMSLSRQDTSFGAKIRAALAKHGVETIGKLAEDKIGDVFAELNNAAYKLAKEG